MRHNRPQKPITKEAIAQLKERQKSLSARPIKKVMEAKARSKKRAGRKIERMKTRANVVVDDSDLSDKQKLEAIQKMMRRATSEAKEKKKPELVVAKGARKGLQGRPRGIKGRYTMVDGRMKKEKRALKRIAKKKK